MKIGMTNVKYDFMRTPAYGSLREHLSKRTIDWLEGDTAVIIMNGDHPRRTLMKEIARIEKEWSLV